MPGTSSLLALDATTDWCSVAWTDGLHRVERAEPAGQRQSELILAMVDEVLREANLGLRELCEIAFGAGPGSFTGLRIACGVAQGLGFGAGLPVRAVSSLLALAQASGNRAVIAAIDARMEEVYWGAYRRTAGGIWQTVAAPAVTPPAAVVVPVGSDWSGAGNAYAAYPALAARLGPLAVVDPFAQVSARAIAELALAGYGIADSAELAAPHYVRDRVARTAAERSGAC
ncbi:MAG: tRNA (adenosine(37)-N6)-threonylcarbamoyltransferase complex dimerization subunit type 1 TsaB [Betaproteobacteria bacterium]